MKYLTIIPDYTSSCIKDDFVGQIDIKKLGLPQDYLEALSAWHESYRAIIPWNDEQRKRKKGEIRSLDEQGLVFSRQLSYLVPGGAKVRYFSEGLMQYIPIT